jgi:shikimate kinase
MNIVLIGYRGTGKSTVAECLASARGRPCACLDEEIVKRSGMSIPEIVERMGWDHFRDLESGVVKDFAAKEGWILDTGGGVILREENVQRLRENGLLIWLTAPPSVLIDRIRDNTQRPALKDGKTFLEEVEEVLQEREPLYRAAAHREIDVASITPEEVSDRIQTLIAEQENG